MGDAAGSDPSGPAAKLSRLHSARTAGIGAAERNENALLAKEQGNLKVITRLYERLTLADSTALPDLNALPSELTSSTVGALFLTTQDMLDDAFELVRLNRRDLAAAQNQAALI